MSADAVSTSWGAMAGKVAAPGRQVAVADKHPAAQVSATPDLSLAVLADRVTVFESLLCFVDRS